MNGHYYLSGWTSGAHFVQSADRALVAAVLRAEVRADHADDDARDAGWIDALTATVGA